uniref:Uncharacterized protein n=1 Tax=Arundo donax TaxID=35708 RepID=A0A0A9H5V7_ARUDO
MIDIVKLETMLQQRHPGSKLCSTLGLIHEDSKLIFQLICRVYYYS